MYVQGHKTVAILDQMILQTLNGLRHQNILITDVCIFMNYTISQFSRRDDIARRKVGWISVAPLAVSFIVPALSGWDPLGSFHE